MYKKKINAAARFDYRLFCQTPALDGLLEMIHFCCFNLKVSTHMLT